MPRAEQPPPRHPIPVILDTDIGDDIDDIWALGMLLRSPELDPRLVVTATGNTPARAAIVAKLLHQAGRADVPIGVGIQQSDKEPPYARWAADYRLDDYPGVVHRDGVGAEVDAILASPEGATLVCIGPLPNVAEALQREPQIAEHARFVGMHGSVYRGYDGAEQPSAEWNVVCDVPAARAVFRAPWPKTITPLDTCGLVRLTGAKYAAVRDCDDPLPRAILEAYCVWLEATNQQENDRSSVLFDTVAIYLAFATQLVEMRSVGLAVTDDGFTVPDASAAQVLCALTWRDLGAFEDLLVERLTKAAP